VGIFPGYFPDCDGKNGTDFAIARLEGFLPKADLPYSEETYFNPDFSTLRLQDKIIITGYPAKKEGNLYQMQGTILDINQVKGLISYNNINTSGG
jgi:hypothetical protein